MSVKYVCPSCRAKFVDENADEVKTWSCICPCCGGVAISVGQLISYRSDLVKVDWAATDDDVPETMAADAFSEGVFRSTGDGNFEEVTPKCYNCGEVGRHRFVGDGKALWMCHQHYAEFLNRKS